MNDAKGICFNHSAVISQWRRSLSLSLCIYVCILSYRKYSTELFHFGVNISGARLPFIGDDDGNAENQNVK